MNEMMELIENQNEKVEQIVNILTKEIKTENGLFSKLNSKMAKLEDSQVSFKQSEEAKFKSIFLKFLTMKLPDDEKSK